MSQQTFYSGETTSDSRVQASSSDSLLVHVIKTVDISIHVIISVDTSTYKNVNAYFMSQVASILHFSFGY